MPRKMTRTEQKAYDEASQRVAAERYAARLAQRDAERERSGLNARRGVRTTARALLEEGHKQPPTREERRARSRAEAYQPNPELERLLELRDSDRAEDREVYRSIISGRPSLQLAAAHHERDIEAARAAGLLEEGEQQ